jgi:signal transduction histidine kinase
MQSVQLLKSLGMILEDATPDGIPAKIVQTSLNMLRADLGALLRINDANYADIEEAYDRIMERHPAGISLNLSDQPTLMTAYEYRRQRSLFPDKRPGELDDLYTRFDVEQRGPAYFQPLIHKGEVIAVLLIAYPYTQRELRPDQIELLKGMAIIASNLLSLSYEAQEARNLAEELTVQAMVDGVPLRQVQESDVLAARQEMQTSLRVAREQINNLTQQVSHLETELDSERQRLMNLLGNTEENLSLSQRIRAITDEQEQLRDERNRLMKRVQEAEAALNGMVTPSDDELAHQVLQQVQREKETLEAERDRLRAQLDDLRAQDKAIMPEEMQELVNRMVQEKTRLEQERNQLSQRLEAIQANLREAGIQDDTEGIIQLIQRLYSERVRLLEENEQLQREHGRLLQQTQTRLSDDEQSARIETLEQDVEHLAADREAALKQRHQWRNEIDDLRDQLNAVKEHRARLMAQVAAFEMERQEIYDEQRDIQANLHEMADEISNLRDERDRLRATLQAITTERNQLLAGMEGDPARLKQVSAEGVGALRQMVNELSAERDRLAGELNDVRRKLVELEQQQEIVTLTAISNGNGATYQPEQPELLVGLVQELRTPMTSINDYLELLLNESAGILGEKQRKFMHRVAANIQRLDIMIDSLVKITELDTGAYRLEPRPVDVVRLVEESITNAALQFREKGLAVNLNIDDSLPTLPADEDAVRQIVGQLLTNAYLASPADTAITVTVARREMRLQPDDKPRDCLYLAIEDRGGGIMPEDIPRVFARKYRAENPLIDGLGDTGVGMSIAQTLVEAHEGHLWVESKMGRGTIFSFAIPLNLPLSVEND